MSGTQLRRERLGEMRERELQRFVELRPRGMGLLERARPHMPNGVPMTWMVMSYEHPPIVVKGDWRPETPERQPTPESARNPAVFKGPIRVQSIHDRIVHY